MLWYLLLTSHITLAFVVGLTGVPSGGTPRNALDPSTQKLHELLFLGLTERSAELTTAPGIASKWHSKEDGREWSFTLRTSLKDHGEEPISPSRVLQCIRNYLDPKQPATTTAALVKIRTVTLDGDTITFQLEKPDPRFDLNVSVFRYFRGQSNPDSPCSETADPLWTSGPFRPDTLPFRWREGDALSGLSLVSGQKIQLRFSNSNHSLLFQALRSELDVLINPFTITQSIWFAKSQPHYRHLSTPSTTVDYLALNHRHPELSKKRVRQQISSAIPRDEYVRYVTKDLFRPALTFLVPASSRSNPAPRPKPKPERLTLRYLTTPSTIGMERSLVISSALKKIGIDLKIEAVESGLFFSKIRTGDFDLFASRWTNVMDPSIYESTTHSQGTKNRVFYKNPQMDQKIERGDASAVEQLFADDLPYVPLWFWHNEIWLLKSSNLILNERLSPTGSWRILLSISKMKG